MDLEYIYGSDVGKEGFAKTNRNFSAVNAVVARIETSAKAYADTVSATAKTEAIADTQTWAKGTFSRENKLRNSDFKIQQRGTTFVAPSNIYTADMWKCNGSGTVTLTSSGMQITGTVTVSYIMFNRRL